MRAIQFVELTREGSKVIGTMTVQKGKLVLDPPNEDALQNIARQPITDYAQADAVDKGEPLPYIDSTKDPEAFLKACLATYRGTYLWAEDLSTQEARPEE